MRRMYSENQIAELVKKNPEAVVKALENQDITAKTLEQSEANWTYNGEISFPDTQGLTGELVFGDISQFNRKLNIVIIGKYTNNTESAITLYQSGGILITLPASIAEKVIDYNGKSVHENSNGVRISGNYAYISKIVGGSYQVQDASNFYLTNRTEENQMIATFAKATGVSIGAGETAYFEGRIELII